MKRTFSHFCGKITILLIPFICILIYYISIDPFKVIHTYKSYSEKGLISNNGYVNWQSYLNHRDSVHYNSFIFGNSCAMGIETKTWTDYINNAKPVKLNCNNEGLYAIHKKITRLDEKGDSLKNVIILLDHSVLKKTNESTRHSYILHPDITGCSQIKFQFTFAKAFLIPTVFMNYFYYTLTGKCLKGTSSIINVHDLYRNQITNDFINPRELEIKEKKERYWVDHQKEFPKQANCSKPYNVMIKNKHLKMLSEIKAIFSKHHSNYHIIINPEWKQKSINPKDLRALQSIFGMGQVHNYSGKNKFTNNKYNFYEKGHYRPILGKKILDEIYLHRIADNKGISNAMINYK